MSHNDNYVNFCLCKSLPVRYACRYDFAGWRQIHLEITAVMFSDSKIAFKMWDNTKRQIAPSVNRLAYAEGSMASFRFKHLYARKSVMAFWR